MLNAPRMTGTVWTPAQNWLQQVSVVLNPTMSCSWPKTRTSFALRAAGIHYPATLACTAGGIAMGLGGPVLMRTLRRIMLGNRAGSPQ